MTDNDIITALKRCIECNESQMAVCNNCAMEKTYPECDHEIEVMALDLINRQKAEIERKDRIIESYALQYGTAADKEVFLRKIRVEAIKGFAERIKKKAEIRYLDGDKRFDCIVDSNFIEKLVERNGG